MKLSKHQQMLLRNLIRLESSDEILPGGYVPWKSAGPMARAGAIRAAECVPVGLSRFVPTEAGRAYIRELEKKRHEAP
jgi:hypothetical protein